MSTKICLAVVFLTALVACGHIVYWYPKLPLEIPAHFGADGLPNQWQPKSELVILFGGLHFLFLVMMSGLGYAMRFLPTELMNLPNKEYWLAEERREGTLRFTCNSLLLMGAMTSGLMIVLFQLSAMVAAEQLRSISPYFWIATGGYMAAILGFVAYTYIRFRLPEELAQRI